MYEQYIPKRINNEQRQRNKLLGHTHCIYALAPDSDQKLLVMFVFVVFRDLAANGPTFQILHCWF